MKRLLSILLIFSSTTAWAEPDFYRVEVIVFQNMQTQADPDKVDQLSSFSGFPEAAVDALPRDLPDDLQVLENRSPGMDDIWRRLKSSSVYRPLLFAAWKQNRIDYFPAMRIHDDQVIDSELRPPGNIMIADLTATDPLSAYRSTFYRLDGTVQLRRSRFLHLFLNLRYRLDTPGEKPDTQEIATPSATVTQDGKPHSVFTLLQNRQIRLDEVQYFDTAYLGALVLVSRTQ